MYRSNITKGNQLANTNYTTTICNADGFFGVCMRRIKLWIYLHGQNNTEKKHTITIIEYKMNFYETEMFMALCRYTGTLHRRRGKKKKESSTLVRSGWFFALTLLSVVLGCFFLSAFVRSSTNNENKRSERNVGDNNDEERERKTQHNGNVFERRSIHGSGCVQRVNCTIFVMPEDKGEEKLFREKKIIFF